MRIRWLQAIFNSYMVVMLRTGRIQRRIQHNSFPVCPLSRQLANSVYAVAATSALRRQQKHRQGILRSSV